MITTCRTSSASSSIRGSTRVRSAGSFKPGASGNPAGRPKGARQRFSESFISAMAEDFQAHGARVIATVRKTDPASYLRVVASLQPKQLDHEFTPPSDDELTDRQFGRGLAFYLMKAMRSDK